MKIKNSRVVGNIYETKDYSIFVKLPSNRDVLARRLKRLVESLSIKEILNPIVVNKYYQIIDGQGRYEAKKLLHRPIQYVVDENASIEDCRRMNAYNAPWTVNDYVKSLAEDGNDDCMRLLECSTKLGIPIARVLRLSNHNGSSKSTLSGLETLKFTDDDVQEVEIIWGEICEIKEGLSMTRRINEAFCTGIKILHDTPGYDHNGMLRRCRKSKNTFSMASNLEDMLKEFSRIYNTSRTADKRLYFEDYMRNRGYNARDYGGKFEDESVSTLKPKKPRS